MGGSTMGFVDLMSARVQLLMYSSHLLLVFVRGMGCEWCGWCVPFGTGMNLKMACTRGVWGGGLCIWGGGVDRGCW
jgi:hypothetical protein